MSYKRFNRHEVFDAELMTIHSSNIRSVENFLWETQKTFHNNVTNMLCGIWDGYLYDSLLDEVIDMNLPYEVLKNISKTVNVIEEHIAANGESITLV
jgi:hypothetical protein